MMNAKDTATVLHACNFLEPTKDGLLVSPREGDALVFYNYKETGEADLLSVHAGLPCVSEKWVANHWFRLRETAAVVNDAQLDSLKPRNSADDSKAVPDGAADHVDC